MASETSPTIAESFDRTDPELARKTLEHLLPEEDTRQGMAQILEECIEKAHDIHPSCWGLALEPEANGLHVHVGRVTALSLKEGSIYVILLEGDLGASALLEETSGGVVGTFRSQQGLGWHRLGPSELLAEWPELRSSHLDAVEHAAKRVRRTPYLASHTPGALEALGELLGRTPPAPNHQPIQPGSSRSPSDRHWSGVSGARQREFRSLLGEFLDDFPESPVGKRHLELHRRARVEGWQSFERLLDAGERGGEIAGGVLLRLLPHADTEVNGQRGAWVTGGGTLPGDVLAWLTAIGGAGREHGQRIAAAILDFVCCSLEDPASLPDVCRGFTSLPYTRGFHTGLLTPILNAVRPQEFLALDDRTRRTLNYFAGTSFGRDLNVYPKANALGRQLLDRLTDELSIASEFGLLPCDLFGAFSYWLAAVIQHPLGKPRYWRITVSADEAWWACTEVGALGLEEGRHLGDISRLEREALETLAKTAGAGAEESLDPLWTFCHEIGEGDRVVAVGDDGRVLGIGTVTGPYGFAEKGCGHHRPVDWDDTRPRPSTESSGAGGAVIEIGREIFDAIHETPPLAVDQASAAPVVEEAAEEVPAEKPPAKARSAKEKDVEALFAEQVAAEDQATDELFTRELQPEGPAGAQAGTRDEDEMGSATIALNPFYTLERLAADTSLPVEDLELWLRAIRRRRQAILYGPPGTGKTFLARCLARHLTGGGNGFSELLVLHAGWTYEAFLGGPGYFFDFCTRARERRSTSVLVLDEMHRADLPRMLGEAVYLLERRDEEVPLAGGGRLAIPEKVIALGTLSTAVASPALDDAVLRRRFAFLHLPPRYDVLASRQAAHGFAADGLIGALTRLNQHLGSERAVGIAPFLDADLGARLADIWTQEIEPYLERCLTAEPKVLESFRWDRVRGEVLP